MKNGLDAAFSFYETALSAQTYRQQVLAANITNADTPNYKARDVDFRAVLQAAQQQPAQQVSLAAGDSRHLPLSGNHPLAQHVLYRQDQQVGLDGNSVNLDHEQGAFTDNAIRYQATITFMSGKIKGLLTAIQGS